MLKQQKIIVIKIMSCKKLTKCILGREKIYTKTFLSFDLNNSTKSIFHRQQSGKNLQYSIKLQKSLCPENTLNSSFCRFMILMGALT